MKVVGTAGHIDHGKSTLVRRLTGIDPDRLQEEKLRGMTIDLGFAWLALPSGQEVSIVDVPGHERFVKNMLAGAGGVDVALLVVAADEGVMPQTKEHLQILDLLQVQVGVVALTKSDLVDEGWLQLVEDDVSAVLRGTSLRESPIVRVSAVEGTGIEELLAALEVAASSGPGPEDREAPYLPVDRVFTAAGFGTIVTGTLHDGSLRLGDEVEITPGGRRARIRGLQSHNIAVTEAGPGARVALNLGGVSRGEITRGDMVAPPGLVRQSSRFDAHVRVVPDASFPLDHGTQGMIHIGAAERSATIAVLSSESIEPGAEGWVQVRMPDPVAAVKGQRFIVRLPAPARTVAGGEVVDIRPAHRRSDPAALVRLARLRSRQPRDAVLGAFAGNRRLARGEIKSITGMSDATIAATINELVDSGLLIDLNGGYLTRDAWSAIEERAVRALSVYHARNPLRRGMPVEQLRSSLRLTPAEWPAALTRLLTSAVLVGGGGIIALAAHRGGVSARGEDLEQVLDVLRREPFSPPSGQDLTSESGVDIAFLDVMAEEGLVVRLADGLYLSRDAYTMAVAAVARQLGAEGQLTVAQVRDLLRTSRKYALALLEHMDGEKMTRRRGDVRIAGSGLAECALE